MESTLWSWDRIQGCRKENFQKFKNFFVFDIETVPDLTMLEKIGNKEEKEKNENGEFLQTPFHKVVCLSYMIIKEKSIKEFTSLVSEDESFLLNIFWEKFKEAHSKTEDGKSITSFPVIITVNGKDFDIPVIQTRSLQYVDKIKFKPYISIMLDKFDKWEKQYPQYTHRYTSYHVDIPLDIFGKKMSLKNLCYLCGIPVKQEGDGAKVKEYFDNGDFEKIAKYCGEDVKATAMLFSYINNHFLFNQYFFPSIEDIKDMKLNIKKG